jgi:hypothetical protein
VDLSARWQFLKKHAILKVFCNDLFQTSVINPRIDFKGTESEYGFLMLPGIRDSLYV